MAGLEAYVTLATNESYAIGALVLGQSLRRSGTTRQLVILVTKDVSDAMRDRLASVFSRVVLVDVMDSCDTANLALLERPDLGVTFTKLHCWRLIQYTKAVFMDADTLVLSNIDDLFSREEFSACPDSGWPDCFNSGVFVFKPSEATYAKLLQFALEKGSFDGGDQGLLNMFFDDWSTKDIARHLPFVYNCVATTFYSYAPAFKQFGRNVKVAHFIGAQKPWMRSESSASSVSQTQPLLKKWWDLYLSDVKELFSEAEGQAHGGSVTEVIASMRVSPPPQASQKEGVSEREVWEAGRADYLGADRFENIQKRLDSNIASGEAVQKAEGTESTKVADDAS